MRSIEDINPSKIDDPLSRMYWEIVKSMLREHSAALTNVVLPGNYPGAAIDPNDAVLANYLYLPGRLPAPTLFPANISAIPLTITALAGQTSSLFDVDYSASSTPGTSMIRFIGHATAAYTNPLLGIYKGSVSAANQMMGIYSSAGNNSVGTITLQLGSTQRNAGTGPEMSFIVPGAGAPSISMFNFGVMTFSSGFFGVQYTDPNGWNVFRIVHGFSGWNPSNYTALLMLGQRSGGYSLLGAIVCDPNTGTTMPRFGISSDATMIGNGTPVQLTPPGALLHVKNYSGVGTIGAIVQGIVGQTGDLHQWQDSVGTKKFFIDSNFRLNMVGSTSGTLTLSVPAVVTDHTLTMPSAQGAAGSVLGHSGTPGLLAWLSLSGLGGAANTEPYITTSATGGLSAERVLTGTANQIVVTDNGAVTGTVVLSAPQNLHTSAAFQVASLGIGAAAAANIALDVTGSTSLRADVITLSSNPASWNIGLGTFLRVTSNAASRSVHGIGGTADGRALFLITAGTNPFTLKNESGTATAAERIHTNTGRDILTRLDGLTIGIYDSTTARWRMFDTITAGDETIYGIWTFNGQVTFDETQGSILNILGSASGTGPYVLFTDGDTGYTGTLIANSFLTGNNQWILPDLGAGTDTIAMLSFAATLSNKTMATSSIFLTTNAGTGAHIRDSATSTKRLYFVVSGAVGNNSLTVTNTAARDYAADSDFSCRLMTSGNSAVGVAGAGTAGLLGKHDSTGNTASIAATTIGNTLPAGMYRVTFYLKVTTIGDAVGTDNIKVTVAWNDGTARSIDPYALNTTAGEAPLAPVWRVDQLKAYAGHVNMYCAASTNVTIATTLVNGGATNPAYDLRARIEAL